MEEAVGVSAGWCNSMYSFLAMCLTGGWICRRRNLQEASSRSTGLYTRQLADTSWRYAVLSRTSKQERRPRHIDFGEEKSLMQSCQLLGKEHVTMCSAYGSLATIESGLLVAAAPS